MYFISESVSTLFHLYFHEPQAVYFFHVEFPQALCLISFSLSACYDNLTCGFYNTEPKRTHDIWSHYCVTSTKLFFFFHCCFLLEVRLRILIHAGSKGVKRLLIFKKISLSELQKVHRDGEYGVWGILILM